MTASEDPAACIRLDISGDPASREGESGFVPMERDEIAESIDDVLGWLCAIFARCLEAAVAMEGFMVVGD